MCDPCYGKGENGGKDIRARLRGKECQNGCKFEKFLDPGFYPLSQKGAYNIHRRYQDRKAAKALARTKSGINGITRDISPCNVPAD